MKKEILIDLRNKNDYNNNHLDKAININFEEIISNNCEIDFNSFDKIYCYCYSGNKSKFISEFLNNKKIECCDLGSFENAKKYFNKLNK